jgi:hypothetical protein
MISKLSAVSVKSSSIEVSKACGEWIDTIDQFQARNEGPKRYFWRANGEDILREVEKAKRVLNGIVPRNRSCCECVTVRRDASALQRATAEPKARSGTVLILDFRQTVGFLPGQESPP